MTSSTLDVESRPGALRATLSAIDGQLLGPERPNLAGLVHWRGGADRPVHRWYRYREGFSPELITALDLGGRILDPFAGSGSIMVGAAEQGRSSVGIDVNPLAAFVAEVKLRPLSRSSLRLVERLAARRPGTIRGVEPWPVPRLRITHKVFEPTVLETLLALRALIEDHAANDRPARDFLLLGWLAILQDVGSYFKEGNGIKYRRRKRTSTGYVDRPDGEWQRERFGDDQAAFVISAYWTQLSRMLADAGRWSRGTWRQQRVITGNATDEIAGFHEDSFDSVVFSPPYANRFDYFESMKVELWFGGFVESYDDMLALRKRSLRSHLGAALDRAADPIDEVESLIEMIDPGSYAVRMRVPDLLRGYFDDMALVLAGCRRVVADGGECHVVVGNSAYGGVIVPTDALLAHLGLRAGFARARVLPVRHLTVAPQQRAALHGLEQYMRESVVTLS